MQRYVPEFERRWNKYSRPVGGSWRCDETYIKVKGGWTYLYRAVDKQGRTVDFLLSERRDVAAAKRFFSAAIRALKREGILPRRVRLRQGKYLNNIVEQDDRSVKKRTWLARATVRFKVRGEHLKESRR